MPTQTLQATDDLYGTPVSDLEDGVYQLMPRRLKLKLKTSDLQNLVTQTSAEGEVLQQHFGGQQNPGGTFNWPAICEAVALDMGVPTKQVARMTLRQLVPRLDALLVERKRTENERLRPKQGFEKKKTLDEGDFPALLDETRKRCSHSLEVVAGKVGVDTGTVFRWIKGKHPISTEHLDRVRTYLDDPHKDN